MANRRSHKRNLSKGILEMKFMKKSKEKADKEQQELESADLFSHNITKGKTSAGTEFIIEHSMVPIERLLNGRMSFKGMNPEVERLMEQERREIKEKERAQDRLNSNLPDISDAEMAKRLGKAVARKFKTKSNRESSNESSDSDGGDSDEGGPSPAKQRKFLKPADD